MSVASKISEIRAALPSGVTLVAVSKFHSAEAILEAYGAGQRIFGESRVQELKLKAQSLPKDIEWHMIGHLQTNKVRAIAPFVSLVHSVDSQRLIECINSEAARCNRVIDCLLELHVSSDESKSGWEIDALRDYLATGAFRELRNIRFRGIMGMATYTDDVNIIRADFEALAAAKRELEPLFDDDFNILSMGMSDDYPIAVECGSTMVRVGSRIFGERNY